MLKYLLFFFGTLSIYAQKEYCFQYDSAGNQRRALLCLNATDEATDEEIFDELPDNLKSSNSDNSKVQLYGVPNPATDQIGVYWQHSENGTLQNLTISISPLGQQAITLWWLHSRMVAKKSSKL